MSSVFLASKERPFPFSMMLVEVLTEAMGEAEGEEEMAAAIMQSLEYCELDHTDERSISYVMNRIQGLSKEAKEQASEDSSPNVKEGAYFGSYAMKWMSELTPDQMCLFLADYDYTKAETFYCDFAGLFNDDTYPVISKEKRDVYCIAVSEDFRSVSKKYNFTYKPVYVTGRINLFKIRFK